MDRQTQPEIENGTETEIVRGGQTRPRIRETDTAVTLTTSGHAEARHPPDPCSTPKQPLSRPRLPADSLFLGPFTEHRNRSPHRRRSASPSALPTRSRHNAAAAPAPSKYGNMSVNMSHPGSAARSPPRPGRDSAMDIDSRVDNADDSDQGQDNGDNDEMAAMQAMLGFGGFGSTKGKKVAGNNVGGVRKEKKTEYRQYMNRQGGFNRPLSPSR